jgi:hypothetical protein
MEPSARAPFWHTADARRLFFEYSHLQCIVRCVAILLPIGLLLLSRVVSIRVRLQVGISFFAAVMAQRSSLAQCLDELAFSNFIVLQPTH